MLPRRWTGKGGGGGQGGTDGEWRTFIPDEATGVSGINIVDIFSADRSLKRRFYKKSFSDDWHAKCDDTLKERN